MPTRLSDYVDGLSDAGALDGTEKLYLASNESTTVDAIRGGLNVKIVNIGDWDMDSTSNINVIHGLVFADIRSWFVSIIDDASNIYLDLNLSGFSEVGSLNFSLFRTGGGAFDNTDYDATTFNRGFITIWHV
jgi:hypothetical protein